MYRRVASVLLALGIALGLALVTPPSAQAAQNGFQTVRVTPASWSPIHVSFACGAGYSVPVGALWGEGQANPKCGRYQHEAEPHSVWVGPGWCVSRWINNSTVNKQVFVGGSNGGWFRIWSTIPAGPNYTNKIESWHGAGCPTSGGPSSYGFQW